MKNPFKINTTIWTVAKSNLGCLEETCRDLKCVLVHLPSEGFALDRI